MKKTKDSRIKPIQEAGGHKRLNPAKGDRALADLYRKITEAKQKATALAALQVDNGPSVRADVAKRFPALRQGR
ncbi:hypothetical protein SAMN05443287_106196 [Micromonospora phaseoli]|uniref:Uncharacterized protein n=1 Tax=Micromonospora phaseoli TaxID=1144548 RepID=A0A1H7AKI7_9ACTN|nr:hypothetical protein [Micromonospora phaseoli]PZV96314.1 hypothetical protein CLV64_107192 [Micromonospora phaseoli]GIJ75999.1 hypothetical protein Xph01_04310 [Micromonospora phaseoli]SEJ66109.1 hypothetical protein SAMN05443287_106196 [Micromonospora phaseoli]